VQPYLEDLKTAPPESGPGRVLGMAVQVASGTLTCACGGVLCCCC
jgi:hypothetical protein